MGAFASRSFFFYSDGKGIVCSKWLMPYRQNCEISVLNLSPYKTDVHIDIVSQPYKWDNRSLYFHTVWKQERGLPVVTWMEHEKCMDWNFTTISGRGVYRGDLLSLSIIRQSGMEKAMKNNSRSRSVSLPFRDRYRRLLQLRRIL